MVVEGEMKDGGFSENFSGSLEEDKRVIVHDVWLVMRLMGVGRENGRVRLFI